MDQDIAPKISIVMSVYNGASYLRFAIDSILQQTFTDFEFIIIDDGSTDETASILKKYVDPRIRVITQENKGLVASLNLGTSEARGKYIARQDADDISEPERLAKQVNYLQMNPKTVIVGSSMKVMDETSKILQTHSVLLGDSELRQELLVRSPFAHGSVIFSRDAAIKAGLYNQEYWPAEDYDLWLRLSKYGLLANLEEALYVYREHSAGISMSNQKLQTEKTKAVQELAWQNRKRLLSNHRINLAMYKKLDDGNVRIQRIIANVLYVNRKARQSKHRVFAIKNTSLILRSPTIYKKVAGVIRRRIRK